jgi:hypothetical protein
MLGGLALARALAFYRSLLQVCRQALLVDV